MSEMKPCPFCGKEPASSIFRGELIGCPTKGCPINCGHLLTEPEKWNTRPIEDKLHAEVERLRELMRWKSCKEPPKVEPMTKIIVRRWGDIAYYYYSPELQDAFSADWKEWREIE